MARRSSKANRAPKPAQVEAEVRTLYPQWLSHTRQAKAYDAVARGRGPLPVMPADTSNAEYAALLEMSPSPYGSLVTANMSQAMFVEGYRADVKKKKKANQNSPLWGQLWQANGFDARQIPVHNGAFDHGESYILQLRGEDPLSGAPSVVWRGKSAMKMATFYDDDETDDFPAAGLEGTPQTNERGDDGFALRYYDDNYWHTLWAPAEYDEKIEGLHWTGGTTWHGTGRVPIVRFANRIDLDGRTTGEIEPLIPLFARIDQDTFDRLVVQRFGAWMIRWATGLEKPTDEAKRREMELFLRGSDRLLPDPVAGKFGTLSGTPLDGFISAREHDIRDLAALSQTPPHYLTGSMINLSAEALAAAEAALMRKVDERKHNFGEAWELNFRLGAHLLGQREASMDFSAQVRWKDTESRSLVQVATALGIMAKQLNVPVEMLWSRLPNWTQQETDTALKILKDRDLDAMFLQLGLNTDSTKLGAEPPAPVKSPVRVGV